MREDPLDVVGGGAFPVKRIPLPRVPAALLDVGYVDLGSPLEVTIVLDQDSRYGVRATGPVGQSGLQIAPGPRVQHSVFSIHRSAFQRGVQTSRR